MEKDKKLVEQITPMDEDFAQWYTDIIKKAELADYSSVRGCMIIRPYAYAMWENIQGDLDRRFKETGHENVYMPMFIPEGLLQKEKDHVEGFAPEVAWVTQGGNEELTERLCVRPTSETLFCEHYAKTVQSYNDLPKLYNQWCSVVRWEKTTRPFLRTTEFLWNEGHTVHATQEESEEETIRMLNVYADHVEQMLAIPVIRGEKTEKERFAGAIGTYTIEALMHDGKALQAATSHNFGTNFAEAFNMQYTDKNGKLQYVHQTSWGITTRLIGAIIMVHGDDSGLKLPPRIAPIQVVIVPIAQHKEGVLEKAAELKARISKIARVKVDDSDKMPGWKFAEYEMKGVPIRLEVGPKDIEKNQVVLVRRDNGEKISVSMDEIETKIPSLLDDIHNAMFEAAKRVREQKTSSAVNMEEFKDIVENKTGFVKAMWCGDRACEDKIKEETGATSRCIPFKQEKISDTCVCCGKKTDKMVYWGRAY
ncbi:proline--tRNA ligase [Clostridium carboxidivorans P7]|uniref:Proline--tRNA ligase n=1 Tax=Clostridium carboxidivorans P7 TaxID=536227 RepID=C6PNN2_9CLOT|nr:proline--tRNA ligase [Clostridium carboxidivorans]AKN32839.1 proline--tRNA ligase [Clostridium carboxidivorans P7]EET89159.1 prolyl-tRNA synthetase [Clostridium carboxidivorans P7]EFG89917.1 prolyl-tRNA synthetase [Clostridium carboxidivorans P7]